MADKREWMDALSDPRDGSCAQSEEEAFKGCRERLARAEAEFQQVAQRFEQAYSLSVVAALPVTEAYRLIATHGLGFTATVEEWLLRGYHLPQAASACGSRERDRNGGDAATRCRTRLSVDKVGLVSKTSCLPRVPALLRSNRRDAPISVRHASLWARRRPLRGLKGV